MAPADGHDADEAPLRDAPLRDAAILEGIVTTLDESGDVNVSPMGPRVDPSLERLLLRPFAASRTCRNLRRRGEGVLHVVDDVELLARAAVGRLDSTPPLVRPQSVETPGLADACRWYAFRVERIDDSEQRVAIECRVVERRFQREFFGFNRAKHAVLEAAILATRLDFLPRPSILDELARLQVLVAKTAGPAERRAFAFLQDFIASAEQPAS